MKLIGVSTFGSGTVYVDEARKAVIVPCEIKTDYGGNKAKNTVYSTLRFTASGDRGYEEQYWSTGQ